MSSAMVTGLARQHFQANSVRLFMIVLKIPNDLIRVFILTFSSQLLNLKVY